MSDANQQLLKRKREIHNCACLSKTSQPPRRMKRLAEACVSCVGELCEDHVMLRLQLVCHSTTGTPHRQFEALTKLAHTLLCQVGHWQNRHRWHTKPCHGVWGAQTKERISQTSQQVKEPSLQVLCYTILDTVCNLLVLGLRPARASQWSMWTVSDRAAKVPECQPSRSRWDQALDNQEHVSAAFAD